MDQRRMKRLVTVIVSLASVISLTLIAASPPPAHAQTIVDEWSGIKAPPVPELKRVTIDPKVTALLVLDIVKQTCPPPPPLHSFRF